MSFFNASYSRCLFHAGTLLRKLEAGLRGISHVVVDEIHERDLNVSVSVSLLFFYSCSVQFSSVHLFYHLI